MFYLVIYVRNHNNNNERKDFNENNCISTYRREELTEVTITISAEIFDKAGINPYEDMTLTVESGRIVITPTTVLGHLPEDLLELYEEIGISREKVEQILGEAMEKAGSFDEMLDAIENGTLG